MKTFLKIFYWLLVFIAVIQFVPIDRTNKPVKKSENFVDVQNSPPKVRELLKNACYDCHSNETAYPDYAYVAPISWSVKDHVNEGREHLNFSEWTKFNTDLRKNMLENTIADLQDGRMPMSGYVVYHPKANLRAAEKKILVDYFSEMLKSGKY